MLMLQRQQRLLQLLRELRAAQLEQLARDLGVSISTVRRDVDALQRQGLVMRTHGGAVYGREEAGARHGTDLAERMNQQVAAKTAIGRYAASLVQPQMTVLLDGGSTVILAARQITARPIQVVTNSLSIANIFADDDQVELLLIGGSLYPRSGVMVGPIALKCLADLHADLLLFSLAGLFDNDAYNVNFAMAQVEQAMMKQATRRVMLMDAGKFGRKSLARVCGLCDVEQIITDAAVDPDCRLRLGERLIIADQP
jgi:DeoR family transcriptional regulator, fructose operon transcriptional repressor